MTPKDHKNKIGRGILGVIVAVILYLLIPVFYFKYLPEYIPPDVDMSVLDLTVLDGIMERWFLAGIPIVAVAFFRKYYAYGNVRRLAAWTVSTLLSMFWILYITNFGDLTGLIIYNGPDMTVTASFMVLGLIVIAFFFKIMKFVIEYCDYRDNRAAYREENGLDEEEEEEIRVKGKYD